MKYNVVLKFVTPNEVYHRMSLKVEASSDFELAEKLVEYQKDKYYRDYPLLSMQYAPIYSEESELDPVFANWCYECEEDDVEIMYLINHGSTQSYAICVRCAEKVYGDEDEEE